jgi:hypothetical protein
MYAHMNNKTKKIEKKVNILKYTNTDEVALKGKLERIKVSY